MLKFDRDKVEKILTELQNRGELFSGYQLSRQDGGLCRLGAGGFSCVYDAVKEGIPEKHFALKVMGFCKHTLGEERFLRWVTTQNALAKQTPYVAEILEWMSLRIKLDERGTVAAVEKVSGEPLQPGERDFRFVLVERMEPLLRKDASGRMVLRREGLETEREVLRLAGQIGEAISVAHRNNVLHRDIKLENIFWDETRNAYRLGDFGTAIQLDGKDTEKFFYTEGYIAPEFVRRGRRTYDVTMDIYSFGVTLFLLLNKLEFPTSDGYYADVVQYSGDFVFPAPMEASPEMAQLLRRMCRYKKEDRYRLMEEVQNALHMIECDREDTDVKKIINERYKRRDV